MTGNLKRKKDSSKDDRIQLRISSSQKEIISQAAKMENKSLSEFVLDEAYEQAKRILSDNGEIILTAEQWEKYIDALEAPPKFLPELKKLFDEPSIFVEE